jgi:ectoine hydroxylase-related dioxygenase (phytanoyl-CoA dioxygenase family)
MEAGMAQAERFPVSQDDVDTFWRDGAVMIKSVLSDQWLTELSHGVTVNMAQPTKRTVDWVNNKETGERLFHDQLTVQHNPHFERYMLGSPLGSVAAQVMASPTALAFYVTTFVRSPGTQSRTPWHQDQSYWCAEGRQALSIWTALDSVAAGTELELVKGSHLWERPLAQSQFGEGQLGGVIDVDDMETMPVPDFTGADADKYDMMRWPMEPGDILIFHGMTVHGGSGALPPGVQRRSISAQFLGEDVRVTDRPSGCNPDWLPELAENGIGLGDYPACAMCPTITAEGAVL